MQLSLVFFLSLLRRALTHLVDSNRVFDDRLRTEGWQGTNHLGRIAACQHSMNAWQHFSSAGGGSSAPPPFWCEKRNDPR